ncbi:MAG: DegT/DnrJ/EryC1/StrS family aminotransferase [Armatimonadia bacterium]
MSKQLAIHGGPRAVPEGTIKPWPPIDETDFQLVKESLSGTNHTFGPNCTKLQEEFAAWNGNGYAILTNSGTAALHMAVYACGCGAGDEVIVTSYSWSSSATCILHHNSIPVFVDINYDTMNIDEDKIEAAISPKTKAIIAVHLHGLPCNMDKINAIAKRHNLPVIEDCCQAHGATFGGVKVGKLGNCAAFSFNQNKCMCSGEGGMFVTDDEEMAQRARMLWSFGETRTPSESRDYHAYALGWMYRSSDLVAAFGRAQLAKLDRNSETLLANWARLTECLEGTPNLILPREYPGAKTNGYNFTMRFDMEAMGHADDARQFRDKLVRAMNAEGVQTGVWQSFILPEMTVFRAKNGYGGGCPWSCPMARQPNVDYDPASFPVAQRHCETHTGMTQPLRAPNGPEAAELTAEGIRKVLANIGEVEAVEL